MTSRGYTGDLLHIVSKENLQSLWERHTIVTPVYHANVASMQKLIKL